MLKEAFESCPYFESCQINKCPLASNFEQLENLPEDKLLYNWHKCKLRKKQRALIGKKYGLKNLGLFPREKGFLRKINEQITEGCIVKHETQAQLNSIKEKEATSPENEASDGEVSK